MPETRSEPWRVSLHGGHSGDYCLHASDTLPEMLDAAVAAGYSTFGVTEHAPRSDDRFLYDEERQADYSSGDLHNDFERYAVDSRQLAAEYAGRLEVLRGAEVEVVPEDGYADDIAWLRARYELDYVVGSVHWVDEIPTDYSKAEFERAVAARGGLEPFLVRYFELAAEMVERVAPEVVGHIDRPREYTDGAPEWESAAVRKQLDVVLERMHSAGSILDVNLGPLRAGGAAPCPSPWIVERAQAVGVPFCFGDDSHSIADVGTGLDAGRAYLRGLGVETITKLTRRDGAIVREIVPLS